MREKVQNPAAVPATQHTLVCCVRLAAAAASEVCGLVQGRHRLGQPLQSRPPTGYLLCGSTSPMLFVHCPVPFHEKQLVLHMNSTRRASVSTFSTVTYSVTLQKGWPQSVVMCEKSKLLQRHPVWRRSTTVALIPTHARLVFSSCAYMVRVSGGQKSCSTMLQSHYVQRGAVEGGMSCVSSLVHFYHTGEW